MATLDGDYRLGLFDMLRAQGRVILALMLHDIGSRFGGSPIGFFAMGVGWPLSHIFLMLIIFDFMGRAAPYGDSAALWFATGLVPFLGFQYMSRFMSLGVFMSKPLLSFTAVKTTDVLFARAITEVLNTGLVTLITFALLWLMGIDFLPRDCVQAGLAMLSMMLLGLSFGALNAVIAGVFPFWVTGYALFMVLFWFSSGVVFVPDVLPEAIRTPISYLPWLQGVEWVRSAYYDGMGDSILDKSYMLRFALVTLFIGLSLERLLRGKLLRM